MSKRDRVFNYQAIRVQQQPGAREMYIASIPASELLAWADVPNAKADYMAGYQRVYDPERAEKIRDFISSSPENILPGAVIVAVGEGGVEVKDKEGCICEVKIKLAEQDFFTRLKTVHEHFLRRLSAQEKASISLGSKGENGEDGDDENIGIPESYLAQLTGELGTAVASFESIDTNRGNAIRNYVDSVSKPGLIIDGQHRVFGAKDVSEFSVNLPVVLLPGLPTAEQVFHFYVLNNKAKPLTPTELRRTISTSLSNEEIDGLWKRFEDAGVDPEATRWTHKINTDANSPFKDLVNFGFGGGFIKENVAYQLISRFANMPRKYRSLTEEIKAWKEESDERLTYFYAFWAAIKERYLEVWDASVSQKKGQIFYKAGMLVLQEYVLDGLVQNMNLRRVEGKGSIFNDLEEFKKYVKAVLTDLPPEFFSMEWQEKQVDTKPGHKLLRSTIDQVVSNRGKYLGNFELFKKKS